MHSELIVFIMTGKKDLDEIQDFLEIDHDKGLFELIDTVRIHHDTTGQISYQQPWKEAGDSLNNYSYLAGEFAEIIFSPSRVDDRHQLADAGIDPFFMRKVNQAFISNSFAYLLYVPNERLIDSRRIIEILGELQGDLYHTIFRPQVEEVLLKQK